jgi:hypothetical protein
MYLLYLLPYFCILKNAISRARFVSINYLHELLTHLIATLWLGVCSGTLSRHHPYPQPDSVSSLQKQSILLTHPMIQKHASQKYLNLTCSHCIMPPARTQYPGKRLSIVTRECPVRHVLPLTFAPDLCLPFCLIALKEVSGAIRWSNP